MNTIPAPEPTNIATPFRAEPPKPEPPAHLVRLLASLVIAVATWDFCFWDIRPEDRARFSTAVFYGILNCVILANRDTRPGKGTYILGALMAGALLGTVIEPCLTNYLCLLALTVALAGESYYREIESIWGRWISQGFALMLAPGRIFWLAGRLASSGRKEGLGWAGGLLAACVLAIPALVLALIFGSLLSAGNAVFGNWANEFYGWILKALENFLNVWRMFAWAMVAFLVLPLLRPAGIPERLWKWMTVFPRLPEIIPTRAALYSSGLILVVLNLMFLVANVADALFLWSGGALPNGVSYYNYVHEGVNSLIAAVLLSAVVLAGIFQQGLKVVQTPFLKIFAYIWVAQNLLQIGSVAEKIHRFILMYEMTNERLSTIIFLALVLTGFALLTLKIAQDRSISWLVGGCVIATFFTFYITQFLDLNGWSANYNVARMASDPARVYDTKHMNNYDEATWPALRRAHEIAPSNPDISESYHAAQTSSTYQQATGRDWNYWREFSLRAYWNRSALEENSATH